MGLTKSWALVAFVLSHIGVAHSQESSSEEVDLVPPQVLISTPTRTQAQRRVVFTFEWDQDVSGSGGDSFTASDVVVTDSLGNNLQFRSWTTATENSQYVSNDGYYGDGVVKVDAVPAPYSPGTKFYGVVLAPEKGSVEAFVPELKVCKTGLCNSLSPVLQVFILPSAVDCVTISSNAIKSDTLSIPVTFDFAEDVAPDSFKSKFVRASSYSLDYLPNIPLTVSDIIGGPRKFFGTVNAVNYDQLNLVEVWVIGEKIRDTKGGRFCESNHLRLQLTAKAFATANAKDSPQNRQFSPMVLPYGALQPLSGLNFLPATLPYQSSRFTTVAAPFSSTLVAPVPAGVATTQNFGSESISSVKLYLNSVQTPNLNDGSVTGVKISNNAVNSNALKNGAVTHARLGNDAIDTRVLDNDVVTDKKMVDNIIVTKDLLGEAVDGGSIAVGQIKSSHIADGGVTLGAVADKAIFLSDLSAGTTPINGNMLSAVTSDKVADGTITAKKMNKYLFDILGGKLDSSAIASESITRGKIAFGAVTQLKLANGAVMGNDIAQSAVTIKKIANEAVGTAALGKSVGNNHFSRDVTAGSSDLLDNSFPLSKLDPRLIAQFGLTSDAITTEMIVNRNVDARALAEDSVTTYKISAGGVQARDLAAGSISRDKLIPKGGIIIANSLADRAGVINSNIANEAVSTEALAAHAVTTLSIGDAAVDSIHLGNTVVTRLKLAEDSVTNRMIMDGSITTDKIGDNTITNNALADNSVTFRKVMPIAVLGANFQDSVINNGMVADLAVDTKAFSSDAITTKKLVDLSIKKDNLAIGAVTEDALADKSVITKGMIQNFAVYGENYGNSSILAVPDGSVLGRKIADGGIGAGDIVPNAIDQPLVKPMSITNNGFEDNSITIAKVADQSVTLQKTREKGVDARELADDAITTKKLGLHSAPGSAIRDSQLSNMHFKDASVTARALDPDAVSGTDIFAVLPTISSQYLKDGSIDTDQLQNNVITNSKIALNTVNAANFKSGSVVNNIFTADSITGRSFGEAGVRASNVVNSPIVDTLKLKDLGVEGVHFADNSVTRDKLSAGAVHSDAYGDDVVMLAHFSGALSINARVISDGAIETRHIVDESVTFEKVGAKSVQVNAFATNSVGVATIIDGSVISRHFANRSVTTSKIDDVNLLNTLQFADGSLDGAAFADGSITRSKLGPDAIATGDAFGDGGIMRASLGNSSITSRAIKDRGISILVSEDLGKFARGSVTTTKIADGSVDADAIADGAVVAGDILANSITQRYIADDAIKNDVFASESVTASKLVDGSVSGTKFANGNVTSRTIGGFDTDTKIDDNTVYEPNFADGAITTAHIQDGAVVAGKIGGGVTTAAIPDHGIDSSKISSNGFTDYAIKNKTLTGLQMQQADLVITAKIADFGVNAGKIAFNAITGDKIKGIGGIISQPFVEHSMDASIVYLDSFLVTTSKYRNKSLESESFAVGAASSTSIGSVAGGNFADGVITTAKTDGKNIASSKLADGTLQTTDFPASAVVGSKIAAGSVTGAKVGAKVLDYSVIIETGIDTEKLADGEQGNSLFALGAFTISKVDFSLQRKTILASEITSSELKDGGVATADIADGAITNPKFQIQTITSDKFSGVSGNNFAVDSVTAAKIADGDVGKGPTAAQDGIAFNSNQLDLSYIVDGAITAQTMKSNGVGGVAFGTNSVGASKIVPGAAAGDAFAAGAVTTSKIEDNTVKKNSFAANAIESAAKFFDRAVTRSKLRDQSITGAQIADDSVTWTNTQASVFEQASEAVLLIDMVKYTVGAIDPRCRTAGAKTLSTEHTMSASHGMRGRRTLEDHHSYCARRGLGKAIRVTNQKEHEFHTQSQKQLSAAASMSSSLTVIVLVVSLFNLL